MRRFTYLAAGALAFGGFAMPVRAVDPAPPVSPDTTLRTTDSKTTEVRTDTNSTAYNKGNNAAQAAPDADDIRKTIAKVTEDAVTKGDFHKLTKNFVDADYDRVKNFKASDNFAQLDGRIEQFNKDWKAKYGEDFGFTHHRNDVLNDSFARITQGEMGEARTAGGKEVPSAEPQNVKGGTPEDLKKSGVNQPDANSEKSFGGRTNREAGRNIATFTIPASAKASASVQPGEAPKVNMEANKDLAIPMIHEMPDTWKVDIPDQIDGQKLHDSLLKHLTMVDEDRANWPADKYDAYREVTRHVMMAVMESGM
jgi:hypothetical protein